MSRAVSWIGLPLIASLTLGLAPFTPEPHLFGKVRWVVGGAVGMKPMDWFDLVLHGAPWIWLVVAIAVVAVGFLRGTPADGEPSEGGGSSA